MTDNISSSQYMLLACSPLQRLKLCFQPSVRIDKADPGFGFQAYF